MKKIFALLLFAACLLPLAAAAQQWLEPAVQPDGTINPGHWSTKGDSWQSLFVTPGAMNPLTGQFNPYGRQKSLTSTPQPQTYRSFSIVPGSNDPKPYTIPGSNAPNPYLIPGSNAPNPYSSLRSNPNQAVNPGQEAVKPQ